MTEARQEEHASQAPYGASWKLLEARRAVPEGPRIVGIANQKGGVGKTTTAINLAAALAARNQRVLVVDIDPQSNATTGLGLNHRSAAGSSYDLVMGEASLPDVVVPTAIDRLECVPGSLDLAGAEVELVREAGRDRRLANAFGDLDDRYALVLVDCPPSLGLLTLNALVAAHDLLVPVQCEYYALEGLGQLVGSAERTRRALNPALRVTGFLLTMYDARTKLASEVAAEVRAHFGSLVFRTVIPRSVRLSEAPSFGEPVLTLDPSSRGSISYRLLAAEVEERYGLAASEDPPPPPAEPRDPEPTERIVAGRPGPGGRGYGTTTPSPPGLDEVWPRPDPWRTAAADREMSGSLEDREVEDNER